MSSVGSGARDLTDWMPRGRASDLLTWLSLALAAGLVVLVGVRWYAYQWDFHMFYGAAQDFAAGRSPYRGAGLSFYHPPLTLYGYWLFTFVPVPVALTAWYLLKLGALGGLLRLWDRDFVRLDWQWPTVLFFVLAYNAAIYADLVAGNVSVFEELVLWFGFVCLLRERYLLFSLCVILAAQVKLTPVFFAILFIAACEKPQWRWFAGTLAGFAGVFSLNQWLQPGLFQNFWAVSARLDERGDDTSLLALARDVSDRAFGAAFTNSSRIDEVVFLAAAATVSLISLRLWLHYRRNASAFDRRLVICFSCFVFALVSPRFKVYTYIVLLAPTLYLLQSVDWRQRIPLIGAVIATLVVFPHAESLLPIRFVFDLFNHYMPMIAAVILWSGYLGVMRELGSPDWSPVTSGFQPPVMADWRNAPNGRTTV
jgi:hypothetical protein